MSLRLALSARRAGRCRCFGYLPDVASPATCSLWNGDGVVGRVYGWRPPAHQTAGCASVDLDPQRQQPPSTAPPVLLNEVWRAPDSEGHWYAITLGDDGVPWVRLAVGRLNGSWLWLNETTDGDTMAGLRAWGLHLRDVAAAERDLRKAEEAEGNAFDAIEGGGDESTGEGRAAAQSAREAAQRLRELGRKA